MVCSISALTTEPLASSTVSDHPAASDVPATRFVGLVAAQTEQEHAQRWRTAADGQDGSVPDFVWSKEPVWVRQTRD